MWISGEVAEETNAVSGSGNSRHCILSPQWGVQVYLPSFMFVIVSWVSFLIKPEVVPGRSVLVAGQAVTITNFSISLFFM